MDKIIELRFIPKWLGNAIKHYQTGYNNFESIVSRHDVKLYKVANNLLQTTLKRQLIGDFVLPAAQLDETFSEEDAVFALFGQNLNRLEVAQFNLKYFNIVPDQYDGILIVECDGGEEKNLVLELLIAIALYRGKDQAYRSSSFKQYLSLVNKNQTPGVTPKGAQRFQEELRRLHAERIAANTAETAKEGD